MSSQDLSINKIVYNNELGVFLNFPAIDNITFKLIERNEFMYENHILKSINLNYETQNKKLEDIVEVWKKNSTTWQEMYNLERKQNTSLLKIGDIKDQEIKSIIKKSRRDKTLLFAGGTAVGVIVTALIITKQE